MKKTRLCIITSPNEKNKYLNTIVVAPMTSSSKAYLTRVAMNHDSKKGWIVLDHIRTVIRQRIIKVFGNLTNNESEKVKSVLNEPFVD